MNVQQIDIPEIFRVFMGSSLGARLVSKDAEKISQLEQAIRSLLQPLRLSDRLQFLREKDPKDEKEWLIVKIVASSQIDLFEELESTVGLDAALDRDCASALQLAKESIGVLRKLAGAARMSPHAFHEIVRGEVLARNSLRLVEHVETEGHVLLRDPAGFDLRADAPAGPKRFTLPSDHQILFSVEGVKRYSASIVVIESESESDGEDTTPMRREIALHWPKTPGRSSITDQCHEAMQVRRPLSATVRHTINKVGKVVRLELIEMS